MATESEDKDEFDAGLAAYIERVNPILIPTTQDRCTGTICCHGNQLIYNAFDRTTQYCRLIFIPDITVPTKKVSIDWIESTTSSNENDDGWIQDIVYSNKCSGYLILNRARICLYNPVRNMLDEYFVFSNRTMKRLSCSDKYIYLISTVIDEDISSDEITLMNYDKEEKLNKTFRDIMPSRINRGSGVSVGQFSDIAVGANEQVIVGYRLERRHEVGACAFNVTNDGKEWSCVKQFLLNECWDKDLSFTPRMDWCERLKVFILIEYMSGHLIMIDQAGQVAGECDFSHEKNQKESPINISVSTNDWLCVRYESSISICKITS